MDIDETLQLCLVEKSRCSSNNLCHKGLCFNILGVHLNPALQFKRVAGWPTREVIYLLNCSAGNFEFDAPKPSHINVTSRVVLPTREEWIRQVFGLTELVETQAICDFYISSVASFSLSSVRPCLPATLNDYQ